MTLCIAGVMTIWQRNNWATSEISNKRRSWITIVEWRNWSSTICPTA